MKHHFADFLERNGDYFSIVPNIERFSYIANNEIKNKSDVKVLTICKDQNKEHWEQVFQCPNLEELTLNKPSREQVERISELTEIKRLRVSFFRTKDIDFIGKLMNVEELVLEYVSGFSDLSPLKNLKKLKSAHFENLRKVSDFSGLSGIESLRYLYINGTPDWKQPIDNFEFLKGLPNLEILKLFWVINKTQYPAFAPILSLKKLKKIVIMDNMFATKEYSFIEQSLGNDVIGAKFEPFSKWESGYAKPCFTFLGKGAGRINCDHPRVKEKCEAFKQNYEKLKVQAINDIENYKSNN